MTSFWGRGHNPGRFPTKFTAPWGDPKIIVHSTFADRRYYRPQRRRQEVSTSPFYASNLVLHSNKSSCRAFLGFISRCKRPSQDTDGEHQESKFCLRWVGQGSEKHLTSSPSYQGASGWWQGSRLLSENGELSQDPTEEQLCLQGQMCLERTSAEEGGLGKLLVDCPHVKTARQKQEFFPQEDGHGLPSLWGSLASAMGSWPSSHTFSYLTNKSP